MKNENPSKPKIQAKKEKLKYNRSDFGAIFEEYHPIIRNYVKKKVNYDEFVADDITSITFEKAFKNINKFKWQGISISAWLYKIASNTIIDYYRKESKSVNDSKIHDNIGDSKELVESNYIQFDSDSRIKLIIDSLPERERTIIILKFYEGYTNKAISEKIGISESNVGTILHRSIQRLRGKKSLDL